MRIAFITAIPLNPLQGSGTFAGISALASGLKKLGANVELVTPGHVPIPNFTLKRFWFNEWLRARRWDDFDLTVGFDMDGYRIAGRTGRPHIASIKGVIADEMRFERGWTRLSMAWQASFERRHLERADAAVVTSRYAAGRVKDLYKVEKTTVVIPELIDLCAWRRLFACAPAQSIPSEFSVLTVCRFYPRKRLEVLLEAAAKLRDIIPNLRVHIVGNGPERARLRRIWRHLRLEETVIWLGDVSQLELACEYNRADVFCLPSVQEGFGIVFLEAMAAGKPIVAVRAAAVPEVVDHGLLVEPDDSESLAQAILKLYREPELRSELAAAGTQTVLQYDAPKVARQFLALAESMSV